MTSWKVATILSLRSLWLALALLCAARAALGADASRVPVELKDGIKRVWKLDLDRQQEWTQWEKAEYETLFGHAPADTRRWYLAADDSGKRALIVRAFDRYHPDGIMTLRLRVDEAPPKGLAIELPKAGDSSEKRLARAVELLFNGVWFKPRTSSQHGASGSPLGGDVRDVFLGDVAGPALEDRLRLSVNDQEVLNPWHRVSVEPLTKEWGDTAKRFHTRPQLEMVEFLEATSRAGLLAQGALIQLTTGGGKTEIVRLYLDRLREAGRKFRLLWLVSGLDLVRETEDKRFRSSFEEHGERTFAWYGDTANRREETRQIRFGGIKHLFASMDSFEEGGKNRDVLKAWIANPSEPPVIIVVDEGHRLGARTYESLHDWLWENFSDRVTARIGLSATPIHHLKGNVGRYYGNRMRFAFVRPEEIDVKTGLPRISFLEQLYRAAAAGYNKIPLLYNLARDPWTDRDGRKYTEEEVDEVSKVLTAMRPVKALVFHPNGATEEEGPTLWMREFQRIATDRGTLGGLPSWAVSGMDDLELRTTALDNFARTSEGVLNLTQVGTTGLDIPSTNAVVLLRDSGAVKNTQTIGRGERLSPGAPFNRIVDWSGVNTEGFFLEMADVLAMVDEAGGGEGRAERFKKLLDSNAPTEELLETFAETLGIPPGAIQADEATFRRGLEDFASGGRTFFKLRLESRLPPKLSPTEGLSRYLQRDDVSAAAAKELGLTTEEMLEPGRRSQMVAFFVGNIDKVTPATIGAAWAMAARARRIELGLKVAQKNVPFTVDARDLPEPKEALINYLQREDVLEALSALSGLSKEALMKPETSAEVVDYLELGISGPSRNSLKNSWAAAKKLMRRRDGVRLVEKTSPTEFELAMGTVLPARAGTKETLPEYLQRPDVSNAALTSLGKSSWVEVDRKTAIAFFARQFVRVGGARLFNALLRSGILGRPGEGPGRVRAVFLVKPGGVLPARRDMTESFARYLLRDDVVETLRKEVSRAVGTELTLREFLESRYTVATLAVLRNDLEKVTEISLRDALKSAKATLRVKYGFPKPGKGGGGGNKLKLTVRDGGVLPTTFELTRSLRGYLRSQPVQEAIAAAIGAPIEEVLSAARQRAVIELLERDLAGWTNEAQLVTAWARIRDEAAGAKWLNNLNAWPTSSGMRRELPRVELLHEAVAYYFLKRLQSEPDSIFIFLARDADDFRVTTEALAAARGIPTNGRLLRVVASNRSLIAHVPNDPTAIARVPTADIRRLLAAQGVPADALSGGKKLVFFDVGFDGHSMRPILAALLETSGLSPVDFSRRVEAMFLLSRPEDTVRVAPGGDALDHLLGRGQILKQRNEQQWVELDRQYRENPKEALQRWLRSYGKLRIDEFPLGEAFLSLVESDFRSRNEIVDTMERRETALLTDPMAFRFWLESFVEGRGAPGVATNATQQQKLRSDLGRRHGRLSGFSFTVAGALVPRFERGHKTEASVSPESETRRQEYLCGRLVARFAPK